ncbi:MAG: CoA pyrophosphatase [Chloroflexota bacterium]|nr:CoA pyrophosphatase [Chloroflexota bacterium]
MALMDLLKLKQALARRHKRHITDASRVAAAVLLPLCYRDGQYYLLFVKRTETVKVHKGQMSFPGGTCEVTDVSRLDTALRECSEEIGLKADQVEVLGELDDAITLTTGYIVTPFVGVIAGLCQLQPDRQEIEQVIEIPVAALLDKSNCTEETQIIDGKEVPVYTYRYQGQVIWGATARILAQFLDIFQAAFV